MTYQYQCVDALEPVSDSFGEQAANSAQYNVTAGCLATYSASDMVKTVAAGSVMLNYVPIVVAGNTVTLVSDPSNPRWTWTGINSSGVAVIVSGDPAAIPAVPETGDIVSVSLDLIQTNQTVAANIVTKIDKRVPWPFVSKYKTATQAIAASTAFVDVITAGGGVAAFYAEASAVYEAYFYVPVTFTTTGGLKLQVTGPALPTSVSITGTRDASDGTSSANNSRAFAEVTAFSTPFANADAAAAVPADGTYINSAPATVSVRVVLRNGINAGLVTLQVAQNSAAGTTTLGLGTLMSAKRIA